MMNKEKKYRKMAVSFMAAILLILLYIMIFSFSEQDGQMSGNLSRLISEKCVELLNSLAGGGWTEAFMEGLAGYFENPIRKLAHFAEYACMGVLLYGVWRPWKPLGRKHYFLILLWVFISAAGDELHQLFVPGRSGNIPDVLLDTCGGAFGFFCCVFVEKRKHKRREST